MLASRDETQLERPSPERLRSAERSWFDVGSLDEIVPGTGVAALVAGQQIALVRSRDGAAVYALGNFDPFSKAFVIARGIVGDRGGIPKIASPIYKQNFALESGHCLDDAGVRLPVYPVRLVAGRIQVEVSKDVPR